MIRYFIKRVIGVIAVLLSISFLAHMLVYLMPGDPAYIIVASRRVGGMPTPEEVEQLREDYGLDKPLIVQYINWLGECLKGSFGYSLRTELPISHEIGLRFGPTLLLALTTTVMSVLLAIPIGFLSAWRENSIWDHLIRYLALLGVSVPNFWLGFLLILIFSIYLRLLPTFGMGTPRHMIMPVICLGVGGAARLSRVTRSGFLEVSREEYLLTARAKGLNRRNALFRHGLPNIAGTLIALIATQFGYMIAGALVVETLFAWPGIGNYLVLSVQLRDIPAVQTLVLLYAAIFGVLNFVADSAHALIDPRIRLE